MEGAEQKESRVFRIRRNLKDAGCGDDMIDRFLELDEANRRTQQRRLLSCYRRCLLAALHEQQYKIDCLDHLIYEMENER